MKRHDVSVDRVLGELAKIGFADLHDFLTIHNDGTVAIDSRSPPGWPSSPQDSRPPGVPE